TLFDDEDVTIADTLVKMKSQKAKEKGVAFKDVDDSVQADLDEEVKTKRERQEEASKAALAEFKPQDHCSTEVPKGSGNSNPTASTSNPPADQMETLIVETPIPTVSLPVPTAYSTDSQEPSRIVIRNKAMLVAQGHTQEEGIDYDEMDVKSAFLYGTIDVVVYVMQPLGFQDPDFPIKMYKVEKAMSGLHQAPRAWYGTLSKYLLKNGFQRCTIDQTLFIRKHREDFILVQVYVDDIIFGSSNPLLCREFEALMHEKFKMSAMDIRSSNTPMNKENPWGKDRTRKDVDLHLYRSMTRSLMYLTTSRPDIMFTVCACARHQTIMATSTTEAEYVAAASCCGQVL
nr:hypothetical protein [Tanacetum cinerariifolium]